MKQMDTQAVNFAKRIASDLRKEMQKNGIKVDVFKKVSEKYKHEYIEGFVVGVSRLSRDPNKLDQHRAAYNAALKTIKNKYKKEARDYHIKIAQNGDDFEQTKYTDHLYYRTAEVAVHMRSLKKLPVNESYGLESLVDFFDDMMI